MFELREYQKEFVNNIRYSLAKNNKIIACAATGSGKTKVFISIAKSALTTGKTVLIISESKKIYTQIKNEIENCNYIGEGIKDFVLTQNVIYVAMAQTLQRRSGLIMQFQSLDKNLLIINDEAHIGTSTKLLLQFKNAYLIGFTATPHYTFAKHLPKLYNDCVIGAQPKYLVEQGFLSPYIHFERKIVNLKNLETKNNEFTNESQEIEFSKTNVFETLLNDLQNFEYKKAIIFCASIKQCDELADNLSQYLKVAVYHSQNEKSNFNLYEFESGKDCNVCVSVSALTKGFDFPKIDLVILNRATHSVPLYLQMIGRGSRIFKDKNKFTVLDYGGNGSRLGTWDMERDWSRLWKGKEKNKGVAPIQVCAQCDFIFSLRAKVCPNCNAPTSDLDILEQQKELEKKESVLVELTDKYKAIQGKRVGDLTPEQLVLFSQINKKTIFANRIAKAKGEDFLNEFAKLKGWKNGWQNYIQADENLEFANILVK